MSYVFSTEAVDQAHRFDYFQAAAERSYVRGDYAVPDQKNFRGEIVVESLDTLNISSCAANALTAVIPQRNGPSAPDVVFLQIVLRGRTLVTLNGAEVVTNGGEMTVLDTTQPYAVSIPAESSNLILEIPRAELLSRISSIDRTYGQTFSDRTPEGALAIRFLRTLLGGTRPQEPAVRSSLARQAVDIAALAMTRGDPETVRRLTSPAAVSRLRLHHAIEDSLSSGFATCDSVAGVAGISARYANMLLGQEGTSLERLLLRCRLEKCRDSLADPSEWNRPIGDIALRWGFNSPSHFARAFKEAYGATPREFRDAQGSRPSGKRSAARQMVKATSGDTTTGQAASD